MPKFTMLDENDVVITVNEVHQNDAPDESAGIAFLTAWSNGHSNWAQTTMSDVNPRRCYAAPGYKFDRARDAFIPPKPFPSWVKSSDGYSWEAPIAKPIGNYWWDEANGEWVEGINA